MSEDVSDARSLMLTRGCFGRSMDTVMNLPPPDTPPDSEPPKPEAGLPKPSTPAPDTEPAPGPSLSTPTERTGTYRAGSEAQPSAKAKPEASEEQPSDGGTLNSEAIVSQISDAAMFPIRGKGWPLLTPAVVIVVLMTVVGWVPLIGWIISLTIGCYLSAYLYRSIDVSMRSGITPPDWPDLSKLVSDVVLPGLRLMFAMFVSSIPAILLSWMDGEPKTRGLTSGEVIGMAAFAMYFPMAALAVVGRPGWGVALPQEVIPAIQRCLPDYFVIAGGVFVAEFAMKFLQSAFGWVSFLGVALGTLVYFYLMLVNARLMGLMFSKRRKDLDW